MFRNNIDRSVRVEVRAPIQITSVLNSIPNENGYLHSSLNKVPYIDTELESNFVNVGAGVDNIFEEVTIINTNEDIYEILSSGKYPFISVTIGNISSICFINKDICTDSYVCFTGTTSFQNESYIFMAVCENDQWLFNKEKIQYEFTEAILDCGTSTINI